MQDFLEQAPELPRLRDITLEDRRLFDQVFSQYPPQISDFTFTNLFIWRHAYQLKIGRHRGFLCLLSDKRDKSFFFPPFGEGDVIECLQTLLRYLEQRELPARIAAVPRELAERLDGDASNLKAQADRNQSDYVYLVRDLIELKGRKYHRKRNHIKKFQEKYPHHYVRLTAEWIPQCLQLEEEWCNLRHCEENSGLSNEYRAIKEAFTHFSDLEATGGAIAIDGKVQAFTLGQPLNPNTVVIHFEKANPAYEGLYAAVNQAFLKDRWSEYTFVNREQDLGEEGLRKAKESYFPHHMVDKFAVTWK